MKKILIAYDTVSDSTQQAATIVFDELKKVEDVSVDLKLFSDVRGLADYDVVIIGSPMRFKNFNGNMRRFIGKNRQVLKTKQVAFFLTCLYLIEDTEWIGYDLPIFIDPSFDATPKPLSEMNMMDKTHSDGIYVETLFKQSLSPTAIAFFKGRLNLDRLGFFSRLFMRVVVSVTRKEQVGDFLNPASVSAWARSLKEEILEAA